jgi:hypothetical protein
VVPHRAAVNRCNCPSSFNFLSDRMALGGIQAGPGWQAERRAEHNANIN